MTVKTFSRVFYAIFVSTVAAVSLSGATETAPDFTLKSTQGDNVRLSEHRGEVLLVNFWASWCGPCRQEMPLLDSLQQRYSKLGFNVVGVNVDKDSALANKLLKDIPVTFPVLLDNTGAVSASYNVSAMPTTVLIDRDGNVRYLHKGYKPGYEQDYEQQIKELIRE
ncbi:MAG: TlpA disulfide reductase family protein [Spongiibacteraceae bacterium]